MKIVKSVFIIILFITFLSISLNGRELPINFFNKSDTLKTESEIQLNRFLPDKYNDVYIFMVSYFGALIEHESCISLTNSRCWSEKSEFITKYPTGLNREQGVGLGMITRAWRSNGMLRLDTLNSLKRKYPKELKDLNWNNIKDKPDLQIRAMLLLFFDNFNRLPNHLELMDRVAFSDSAYNGGLGYIIKDRKRCGLLKDCDPDIWFNNVEKMNSRGNKILYGNRSANEINRNHVSDILTNRFIYYFYHYYENISDTINLNK